MEKSPSLSWEDALKSKIRELAADAVDLLLKFSFSCAHRQQRGSKMFLRLRQLPGVPGRGEQGEHPSGRREDEEGTIP